MSSSHHPERMSWMGPFKDSYGREYLQLYGPNGRPTERDYAGSEDTFLLNQKNSSSLTQDLLGNSSYGLTSYSSDNFAKNNRTFIQYSPPVLPEPDESTIAPDSNNTGQGPSVTSGKMAKLLGGSVILPSDISDDNIKQLNTFLWRFVHESQTRVRLELKADNTPEQHLNFLIGLQHAVGAKTAYGNWTQGLMSRSYWVVECAQDTCDRIAIRYGSAERLCDDHKREAIKQRKRRRDEADNDGASKAMTREV
jgi:hypothetical protein